MKRTALTLTLLVGLFAFTSTNAQAAPTTAILGGVVSQTLAKPHHGHNKHQKHFKHHGHRKHHGHHWQHGHRKPPVVIVPAPVRPPVCVRPRIYYPPYVMQNSSFYYSSPDFSFGFGF